MAPRTRKRTSDPDDSIHPTQHHAKASPTRSRSTRAPRTTAARYRQSTLTQIVPEVSFLSRGSAAEESEDEEHIPRPVKRRRRRIGPSQKTLTQIGWINPLVIPSDDEEQAEEVEGEGDGEDGFESEVLPSDDDEYDEVVAGEQNGNEDLEEVFYGFSDDEENHGGDKLHGANPDGVKDTPHTPRRPRPREIPSSQTPPVTPLTPLSVLRKRAHYNGRSPLKVLSTNGNDDDKRRDRAKMPPPKFPTPVKGRSMRVAFDSKVVKVAPALLSERSHVSDSQDLGDEEGCEASPRGVAIGQETQAMIHQIDAACGLNSSGKNTPSKNRVTPEAASESPSPSQASRSFNFDEEDDAGAAPNLAPANNSPILGNDVQEDTQGEDNGQQDIDDENVEEEDEDDGDEEFPTSSFPTPRAPPPTQATPTHTPTQEARISQPFALQHPSQVSTVAETTQATPPRAIPRQRKKPSTQKLGRARHQTVHPSEDVTSTSHGTAIPSQASTTDDPIQSQTPKAEPHRQSQQQQDDRIPESPLARDSSKTNASHSRDTRPRSRKTRSSSSHAASSSIRRPPPALLLTSSPTSPSLSTGNKRVNVGNVADTPRRLELYSGGSGGGNAGALFDGKVMSATQMLPESLMNYSLPLPPAGWDASSVGWVASSMPEEEEEEGEGED